MSALVSQVYFTNTSDVSRGPQFECNQKLLHETDPEGVTHCCYSFRSAMLPNRRWCFMFGFFARFPAVVALKSDKHFTFISFCSTAQQFLSIVYQSAHF